MIIKILLIYLALSFVAYIILKTVPLRPLGRLETILSIIAFFSPWIFIELIKNMRGEVYQQERLERKKQNLRWKREMELRRKLADLFTEMRLLMNPRERNEMLEMVVLEALDEPCYYQAVSQAVERTRGWAQTVGRGRITSEELAAYMVEQLRSARSALVRGATETVATTPVQKILQQQRKNTERCISILASCRTKDEILDGFRKAGEVLKQANDPLAESVERAAIAARALPDEYVHQLRDDFIAQCKAFLSATERGI